MYTLFDTTLCCCGNDCSYYQSKVWCV